MAFGGGQRRAVDHFRQSQTQRHRLTELRHRLKEDDMPDIDAQVDYIEDDVLRLIFLTCHPVLSPESRAALTLRLVAGLTTEEIAAAFLVKSSTMGQRISRAKRTLAESGATIEMPAGRERRKRLDDVLAVIYLIFDEGYAATAGPDWIRPDLCSEALRLARTLTALVPDDAEVHSLQALLELQASRTHARTGTSGEAILLEDQDRARWDHLLIRRGLAALSRAEELGQPAGVYTLQAAIAACHAKARTAKETDWQQIASLYDVLAQAAPNPVVEVNRAVAYGRAYGPEAGLAILAPVAENSALAGSHLLSSVRGDLLALAGRSAEAASEFRRAAALTRNEREREVLLRRVERLQL
jgi:predicted RNA polymerase sigma factor